MELIIILLFIAPLISAGLIYKSSLSKAVFITTVTTIFLTMVSIYLLFSYEQRVSLEIPSLLKMVFVGLDFLLLGYFLYQGKQRKDLKISLLALTQLLLFIYLLSFDVTNKADILVDRLSIFMFSFINFVGGIITIYAVGYMKSENMSDDRKKLFISLLVTFLAVMNFIVSVDNIELFFLAFETTTLFSYLLIGYRKDEISIKNSSLALWMNQIGGVFILIALIYLAKNHQTYYFSSFETLGAVLIPLSFLMLSGFVKGAFMPFDRWLLGAMVAPTPVSAILHSSTMVKIAPYIALKLSPFIQSLP